MTIHRFCWIFKIILDNFTWVLETPGKKCLTDKLYNLDSLIKNSILLYFGYYLVLSKYFETRKT